MADPATREQGIALATATRDGRYREQLKNLAEDAKVPEEVRVAAVEGLGTLSGHLGPDAGSIDRIGAGQAELESPSPKRRCGRSPGSRTTRSRLIELLTAADYPLGLRREALRSLAQLRDGGAQILDLASAGKLPADLKNDATTLLHTDSDRRIREQAAKILPLPKTAGGEPLPPIGELIRRNGRRGKREARLFPSGDEFVRGLPPSSGARSVGRARPLDDWSQVRPRRADPLDLEPE